MLFHVVARAGEHVDVFIVVRLRVLLVVPRAGPRFLASPAKPSNFGSAYVFERDGAGVWSEVQKLTAIIAEADAERSRQVKECDAVESEKKLLGAQLAEVNSWLYNKKAVLVTAQNVCAHGLNA